MSKTPGERLQEIIDLFKTKGATSKSSAMTLKELGTPRLFKVLLNSPFGRKLPFEEINGKYYLSEKRAAEIEKIGGIFASTPFQGWVKHTSKVPRGYLRYRVLQLLRTRPMSGSEISSCIEEESQGEWRPSPGSLYPLLNSLSDGGIIEQLPVSQGVKRYQITELGHALFDNEFQIAEKMRDKLRSGLLPFRGFVDIPEDIKFLGDTTRSIFNSIAILFVELKENPNPEIAKEIEKILKSAAQKLENLTEKIDDT